MVQWDDSGRRIYLGVSADLRHLYGDTAPGREYTCARDTYMDRIAIDHLAKAHPEREDWIYKNLHAIEDAIQRPDIAYRSLVFKPRVGCWSQAFVRVLGHRSDRYLAVVLSLAELPGRSPDIHQVITVYVAQHRNFYDSSGQLKERWIEVDKQ